MVIQFAPDCLRRAKRATHLPYNNLLLAGFGGTTIEAYGNSVYGTMAALVFRPRRITHPKVASSGTV